MKPFAILLAGHAPDRIRARLGDFDHWFRRGLRVPTSRVRVIDVAAGMPLPTADTLAGAVITGSAAMVTDRLDWSEQLAEWIRRARASGLPLLGVCYGHQLMAHALGGRVGMLPGGRELGTCNTEVLEAGRDDPLLTGVPSRFAAHNTHEQSVLEVPDGARVLARSARDPHQILRYGPHAASMQLHPEFGTTAMRAYIRLLPVDLRAESPGRRAMLADVHATPHARRLLRRFAYLADKASARRTEEAA